MALSESIQPPPPISILAPWGATSAHEALSWVLDEAVRDGAETKEGDEATWMTGFREMAARLTVKLGPIERWGQICRVTAGDTFVLAARDGDLALAAKAWRGFVRLKPLHAAATRHSVDWSVVASCFWQMENAAGWFGNWVQEEPALAETLWPHAPISVFVEITKQRGRLPTRAASLTLDQWAAAVGLIKSISDEHYLGDDGWTHLPPQFLEQVARTKIFGYAFEGGEGLWARVAPELIDIAFKLLDEDAGYFSAGGCTLWSAPDQYNGSIKARLRAWASDQPERREHFREWLQFLVERRKMGWREAYGELAEISAAEGSVGC